MIQDQGQCWRSSRRHGGPDMMALGGNEGGRPGVGCGADSSDGDARGVQGAIRIHV